MKDTIKYKGTITLVFKDVNTGKERVYEIKNTVVDAGLNTIRDYIASTAAPSFAGIQYLALGDDGTPVAPTDTQLYNETFRKDVGTPDTSTDKKVVFQVTIGTTEYTGTIAELGLFGKDATSTANTGTLFARTVLSPALNKTDSETLTITWTINLT